MAEKIVMWRKIGPRLAPEKSVEPEEVIEELVAATNQTRGSILAVLSELDVVIEKNLKSGRAVRLPNGTTFRPMGKKDGRVRVLVRLNPRVARQVNVESRARWVNAEHIGKSEAEMVAIWNALYPDDPIAD